MHARFGGGRSEKDRLMKLLENSSKSENQRYLAGPLPYAYYAREYP